MVLSVVIVNHNTKAFLENCLSSLLNTMPLVDYEVLVVNNTPSDGSSQMVAERFSHVRFVDNQNPQGFAQNTNMGMKLTNGRFVWLLNPDTLVQPGTCETLLGFMAKHPRAGMVGPRYLNANGSIEPLSCCRFPSLATDFLQDLFVSQIFRHYSFLAGPLYPQVWKDLPFPVDSLVGASILVRRQVIDQVGYLDESFFMFLEETDWCWRVRQAGWEIWHIPQSVIVHFGSGSADGNIGRIKVLYVRSRLQYYLKHFGYTQALLAWISMTIGLTLRVIASSVIGWVSRSRHQQALQKRSQWISPLKWLLAAGPSYINSVE